MLSVKHSACYLASFKHAANSGSSHHHQQHHRRLHHHRHHCPKSVLLNQQHIKRVHWRNSHLEDQPEDINSHYLQISQNAYVMTMRWTDEPWRCAVNARKEGHVFVTDLAEGRQVQAATGDRQSNAFIPHLLRQTGPAWARGLKTGVCIRPGQSVAMIPALIGTVSVLTVTTAVMIAAAVRCQGLATGQALCWPHEDLISLRLPVNLRGGKESASVYSLSSVRLFVTPWTVVHQAPLSMNSSGKNTWSVLPFPSPGDPPDSEWTWVSHIASRLTEPPGKFITLKSRCHLHVFFWMGKLTSGPLIHRQRDLNPAHCYRKPGLLRTRPTVWHEPFSALPVVGPLPQKNCHCSWPEFLLGTVLGQVCPSEMMNCICNISEWNYKSFP